MRHCTLCGRSFASTPDGAYRLATHTIIAHGARHTLTIPHRNGHDTITAAVPLGATLDDAAVWDAIDRAAVAAGWDTRDVDTFGVTLV